MPVEYDASVRTARMTTTRGLAASGTLEIYDAGYSTLLAEFPLHTTGGDVAGDVWTLKFTGDSGSLTDAANASGTAAVARIRNAADTVTLVNNLTVGTSGTNVVLTSVDITALQNVTITSGTITHYT